ncbi:RimJ/RimL family protein N-acetyltransferase [Streptomyces solincola]|uniref:RimJ/RimL family protein N-acetyltransferase n=1 Tax=Streptomyces solincola TaxID=2100817 RepID=A0A2S9PUW7_9ACTN|nr:GNAT family protein [Streptomyces solincola]PRH78163.1 RimJ/RimL family protein N-acetyltransferase [Streptomyces solincola]
MYAIPLGVQGAELGPLEPWQAGEFLAHMDRGREYIGRYVPLPEVTADLASARAWLQRFADKAAADTGRLWGIRQDGRLVGGVLFRVFDTESGVCEAGCWLEPSAAGNGLVTRACEVIVDWAVEQRSMHRVEWHVDPANTPSINVARRLGMTREARLREVGVHRGERRDVEIWAVLAREWRARRRTATGGE